MRHFTRNWPWLLLTLGIAVLTHVVSIHAVPRLVMHRVFTQIGAVNRIHHGLRPDAETRTVVRPSPNMLYSVCPYDLAEGALRVSASVPRGTYWSVSAFDARTNNYFVENDRQAGTQVAFLIAAPGAKPVARGLPIVRSPSVRGLILFRTVINSETRFTQLDKIRRAAQCDFIPRNVVEER